MPSLEHGLGWLELGTVETGGNRTAVERVLEPRARSTTIRITHVQLHNENVRIIEILISLQKACQRNQQNSPTNETFRLYGSIGQSYQW